jgi:hypothetical protein
VDLSKLTTGDKLILGGGLAYLIFMFLPWYGYDEFGFSYSNSGWDYFLGGILPLILIAIMVAHVLISAFAPDTQLPDLQVHLGAGVAAALIVLLRLLIKADDIGSVDVGVDLDRKYGLVLALIAAIVVAAGGVLKSKEGDVAPPATGGGTGSAPF